MLPLYLGIIILILILLLIFNLPKNDINRITTFAKILKTNCEEIDVYGDRECNVKVIFITRNLDFIETEVKKKYTNFSYDTKKFIEIKYSKDNPYDAIIK